MMTTRTCAMRVATLACVVGLPLVAGCSRATRAPLGGVDESDGRIAPDSGSVTVGYGTQRRRDVTGAVGSIVLTHQRGVRVTYVEELLTGRVPGVDVHRLPSGGFAVRIRGAMTGSGAGEPLVLVDGMPLPLGASLAGINPADVARIDVLKDPGTTAIYGSAGVNGVIVITTRRRVP